MSKSRSPNYPALGLGEAIQKAQLIWDQEHHSKFSRTAAAQALGYSGLNGISIVQISTLLKYGLIEGRGDSIKLSADALSLLHDGADSDSRKVAVLSAAFKPELFKKLKEEYGEAVPSEGNLGGYLQKHGFIPAAAGIAARAYRETMALVEQQARGYDASGAGTESPPEEDNMNTPAPVQRAVQPAGVGHAPSILSTPPPSPSGAGHGALWLQVPFKGTMLTVRIDAGSEALTKEHVARVRKYLQLAELDLGGDEELSQE